MLKKSLSGIFICFMMLISMYQSQSIPFLVKNYKIGFNDPLIYFNQGDQITFSVSSSLPYQNIYIAARQVSQNIYPQSTGLGGAILIFTATLSGNYIFYFQGGTVSSQNLYYSQKTINIRRNGVSVYTSTSFSPFMSGYYEKFSVTSSNCSINTLMYRGPGVIDSIGVFIYLYRWEDYYNMRPDQALAQIVPFFPNTDLNLKLPIGQYIMYIYYTNPNYISVEISISLTTTCSSFCKSQINIAQQPTCLPSCGDGIRGQTEICDNGNKIGCSKNCVPDPNYSCFGLPGSSSFCVKQSICGDDVVDQGEACDNGNRQGCSKDCKVDNGFSCTNQIGKSSLCSLCGNGILQAGEECDNKNQAGCSRNCKIDPGFQCRGVFPSVCTRSNPICGNGIIEVAEMCDDGNTVDGDGCTRYCRVETGFGCTGEFGMRSSCSRSQKSMPICGNSLFEPLTSSSGIIQQCDNGNQPGCKQCIIESGWFCSSSPGQKSFCFRIAQPTCGNTVLDLNEECQDGNTLNGDGCSSSCKVEFGWTCSKLQGCRKNQNQPPLSYQGFCGNGRIQKGEECDDGFPVKNGDGCSIRCKIQQGWQCLIEKDFTKCTRI